MRRRLTALLLAMALLLCSCGRQAKNAGQQPEAAILAVAVAKDCPEAALRVLEDFCDDIERLSGNRLGVQLQHWEDPMLSGAQVVFAGSDALAQALPAFAALQADFTFSSFSQMNDALNAPTVQELLSAPLRSRYGYEVQSAFYCGRQYLLGVRNDLTGAVRTDDSDAMRWAVRDVRDGTIELRALTVGASFPKDTLYYADTETLAGLLPPQTGELVLCDLGYRYQTGMLCLREGLQKELGQRDYATVLEAAAIARPACEAAYRQLDEEIAAALPDRVGPSTRLRRQVREEQAGLTLFQQWQQLYQAIEEYGR